MQYRDSQYQFAVSILIQLFNHDERKSLKS